MRVFLSLCVLSLVAAPAAATTLDATLAQPAAKRLIGRDTVWMCNDTRCGGSSDARPVVVCQELARLGGRVDAFAADGRPFSVAQMADCNRFVRPPRP